VKRTVDKEDKAGLYITVIFHLAVIIVLLVSQIGTALQKENSFVLDFTKQEELEKSRREEAFKEDISQRLEEMLDGTSQINMRNVTVNRSALKDDRGTDAEQLYKDAEKLQRDLSHGQQHQNEDDVAVFSPKKEKSEENKADKPYSGPSVLSWELEGRKASTLKIPAYLGLGAGMVTVIITVDNQGKVTNAKVDENLSSPDPSLRSYAIRAARLSRFSASPTANPRQIGNIVYQFIAQ